MYRSDSAKALYRLYKANGICPRCRQDAQPGKVYCGTCIVAMKRYDSQDRERRRAAQTRYVRKRYMRLKVQGLCVACGEKPAERTAKCNACAADFNARYRARKRIGNQKYTCSVCRQPGHNITSCSMRSKDVPPIEWFATARTGWE